MALFGSAVCQFPLTATNYQTADSARQENVDQNGNIQGQYSYVDPNGKTITVKYTAGKDGFRVEGDHLPAAPSASLTPQVPQYQPQYGNGIQNNFQSSLNSLPHSYQNFQQQPFSFQSNLGQFGNNFAPVQPSKPLFTPAVNPYPAATPGQIDNYRKALEEEKADAQKEALGQNFGQFGDSGLTFGQSHRFGAPLGAPAGIPQTPYNLQFGADHGFTFEYNL